jgi:hypothetical protein
MDGGRGPAGALVRVGLSGPVPKPDARARGHAEGPAGEVVIGGERTILAVAGTALSRPSNRCTMAVVGALITCGFAAG